MLDKLWRFLMRQPNPPEHPELDERERQQDLLLSRASGRSVQDIQRDTRRRALRIEVESIRRR